jgi:hypothetical protein
MTTVKAYAACDKVPASARDAATQSLAALRDSFATATTDEAKKAAATACKQGMDSLREGAASLGCSL